MIEYDEVAIKDTLGPVGDYSAEELTAPSQDTMDVTKKMFAIRRLQKESEKFEQQKSEAVAYYDERVGRLQAQITYLQNDVWSFLNRIGESKLSTPAGTASITKREKWEWTDDEAAIQAWAKANAPDTITVSTVESVNKARLKQHIRASQLVPGEIVTVSEEKSIVVRTNP